RHTRSKRDWSSDVCSSDLGWMYNVNFGIINTFLIELEELLRGWGWIGENVDFTQRFLTSPKQALGSIAVVIIWQYVGFQVVILQIGRAWCRQRVQVSQCGV